MNFTQFDRPEYAGIPLFEISVNKNNLPFWAARLGTSDLRIHRHSYIQIIYVARGKLLHRVDGETTSATRGGLFVIPPYVPHCIFPDGDEPFEIVEFEFTPEFVLERFDEKLGGVQYGESAYLEPFFQPEYRPCFQACLSGALRTSVEKLFEEILSEYQLREVNFGLAVKALTLQLLVQPTRALSGGGTSGQAAGLYLKHREAMISALHYIQDHFSEDLSPEDAARVAMLSTSYFRCLFRQMTNRTFTKYMNELRISKAIDLLKFTPDIRITDVCYTVGFNNVNYFNRVFRQITGVSPGRYKDNR